MDVNPETVDQVFERHHTQFLIHGHTHRPQSHQLEVNHQHATRYVLGDWSTEGAIIASLDSDDIKLFHFSV